MDYSLLLCVEKNWNDAELRNEAKRIVNAKYETDEVIVEDAFERQVNQEKKKIKECKIYFHLTIDYNRLDADIHWK